jgi:hypothetical protein
VPRPSFLLTAVAPAVGAVAVFATIASLVNAPSGTAPAERLAGYAIVTTDHAIGCGGYRQCVPFRKGEKLIAEEQHHPTGMALVRRLGDPRAYWLPDQHLDPGRAP